MIILNHLKNREDFDTFTIDDFIGFVNNPLDESYNKDTKTPPAVSFSLYDSNKPTSDNVVSYSAIVLDYDNKESNVKFSDIVDKFKSRGINHIAYTTMGHSAQVNRFRVILPLDNTISKSDWEYLSQNIPNWNKSIFQTIPLFSNIDPTSFHISRFFYVPVLRNDYMASIYFAGRNFCDKDWYETNKKLESYRIQCNGFAKTIQQKQTNTDGAERWVVNQSTKFDWSKVDKGYGQGTNTWIYSMACFLKNCNVPESNSLNLISKITNNRKAVSQWEHSVSRAYNSTKTTIQPYRVIHTTKTTSNKFIKPIIAKEDPDHFYQPTIIKEYIDANQRRRI